MPAAGRRLATAAVAALLAGLLAGPPAASSAAAAPIAPRAAAPDGDGTGREVGHWRVVPAPAGGVAVTWRSPVPLPVTDARPLFVVDGAPLGIPTPGADGRTLSLILDADGADEAAPLVPGRLGVLLSGRVLDRAGAPPAPHGPPLSAAAAVPGAGPGAAPVTGRRLTPDPGRPGDAPVVTNDYRLPARRIAGMPAPVEMLGHVVRPADATVERPLVLFLHGRHEPCFRTPDGTGRGRRLWPCPRGTSPVPSHLGYDYLQRLLAGQGYVTVSVAANGINAQDFRLLDGGAAARATLVRRHLAQWARWDAQGRFAVDMRRVVLVGHSRGGEGVDQASLATSLAAPYRIVGQVLVAPTNFGRKVAAYVPTVTLLPYCDGDVVDLQGQSYTDLARDLTGDDTALHSSVLVMGANHNFFNTEWTPGISRAPSLDDARFLPGRVCRRDSPSRLDPAGQRAVARAYVAGAVALTAGADDSALAMFDGSDVDVPSAGGADVRTHTVGLGRDVRRPGRDAGLAPARGARTRLCAGLSASRRAVTCGRGGSEIRTPHWPPDSRITRAVPPARAFEMRWSRPGQTGGLQLDRPMDLSTATRLHLRTAVDPALGGVRLRVRLYDGAGDRAEVSTPRGGMFLPALPGRHPLVFGKLWAQTLRVPLGQVTGIDLADVRRVDLVGAGADGRVWVLDLAATRPGLAPVPVRRLPRVSLGALRVREGDGPRARVVRVPFRVRGEVRAPARLVVLAEDFSDGPPPAPRRIDLRPGQTRGTVAVRFVPDTVDDRPVQHVVLLAVPARGVTIERALGRLRIVDDDPAPRVRARRLRSPVPEGRAARWQVRLSRPVDYDVFVLARVVRGTTRVPRLRVGDVPGRWAREHMFPVPPADTPLHRGEATLFASLPPGRTVTTLRLPLRRDRVDEGRETVTLRIRVPGLLDAVRRTVSVVG
jgi:hypothetical protein